MIPHDDDNDENEDTTKVSFDIFNYEQNYIIIFVCFDILAAIPKEQTECVCKYESS